MLNTSLIDTEKMLIQIPVEKVQELLYFLNEASKRKKITLRQLQSLCGSLAVINFEQLLVLSAPANKKSSR
jgi:hypothetical protein